MQNQKDDAAARALKNFLENKNHSIEESFARTFCEKDTIRLFFMDEDAGYTDGSEIWVNPSFKDIYKDEECLTQTEKLLGAEGLFFNNPWAALKMVTRALTLHESLHIMYTDFPLHYENDRDIDSPNKQKAMAYITNIIEDSFIEAVGASMYDNVGTYFKFFNIANVFAKKYAEGTATKRFKIVKPKEIKGYKPSKNAAQNSEALTEDEKKRLEMYEHFLAVKEQTKMLIDYFEYMSAFLMVPFFELNPPREHIAEYVEKTKQLFLDGSIAETPQERYAFCKKIYAVILPLIPKDDECKLSENFVSRTIGSSHAPNGTSAPLQKHKSGAPIKVTTRLFTNLKGENKPHTLKAKLTEQEKEFLERLITAFTREENDIANLNAHTNFTRTVSGADYKNSFNHKDIRINEIHPKIDFELKDAYQNIYNRFKSNISSYNAKFLELLDSHVPIKETKYRFGCMVDSKKLGDVKKRFWARTDTEVSTPDLSVLLLVDGSGSMQGERRNAAVKASVILHEVLTKQNITHAIVEHRADYDEKEIDVNVLVNFNSRDEEKYNIMQLDADGNNRDGLAILWAERYINQKTATEKKLILILSDGYPLHWADEYEPPFSSNDTAKIVSNVITRGTNIIAVALDNGKEESTFEDLKEIYPCLIDCNDLEKLTGQLLKIVSKQLQE